MHSSPIFLSDEQHLLTFSDFSFWKALHADVRRRERSWRERARDICSLARRSYSR